jgi:hypothetical protein
MGFSFEHSFVVRAPAAKVWAYLTDPYRVAPALPGASITEKVDDANYNGAIALKVGPVSTRFRGKVRFDTVDAAARTVQMVASGRNEWTGWSGHADEQPSRRKPRADGGERHFQVTVTGIGQFGGMIGTSRIRCSGSFGIVRAELEKSENAEADLPPRRRPRARPLRLPRPPLSLRSRLT